MHLGLFFSFLSFLFLDEAPPGRGGGEEEKRDVANFNAFHCMLFLGTEDGTWQDASNELQQFSHHMSSPRCDSMGSQLNSRENDLRRSFP